MLVVFAIIATIWLLLSAGHALGDSDTSGCVTIVVISAAIFGIFAIIDHYAGWV